MLNYSNEVIGCLSNITAFDYETPLEAESEKGQRIPKRKKRKLTFATKVSLSPPSLSVREQRLSRVNSTKRARRKSKDYRSFKRRGIVKFCQQVGVQAFFVRCSVQQSVKRSLQPWPFLYPSSLSCVSSSRDSDRCHFRF